LAEGNLRFHGSLTALADPIISVSRIQKLSLVGVDDGRQRIKLAGGLDFRNGLVEAAREQEVMR
jgi:hypothetical protein